MLDIVEICCTFSETKKIKGNYLCEDGFIKN